VDGGFGEFEAPEARSGGEKFDADALAAIAGFTEINDAAFLLFVSFGVGEDNHFAVVDLMLEHEQAAVGVDDDGLANFLKFLAIVSAARGLHAHLVEDASAAARRFVEHFGHGNMFGWRRERVNF